MNLSFEFSNQFKEAVACHQKGNDSDAVNLYTRILKVYPDHSPSLVNLGTLLRQKKKYSTAKLIYEMALSLRPDDSRILSNYGNLLVDMKLFEEAEQVHAKACELDSDNIENIYNAGIVPFFDNRPAEALGYFNKALQRNPRHYFARWNSAIAHLQLGDYIAGFRGYELRMDHPGIRRNNYKIQRWDGKAYPDHVLLLTTEQGFGDVIQFARFIPCITHLFKSVIVEVRAELVRLLQSIDSNITVIERGQPVSFVDYQFPLLSLPHRLGMSLDTIPRNIPYLHIEAPADRDLPTFCVSV